MTAELKNKGVYLSEFLSDYTVIDIETTGLSSKSNEIIEISALKIRNDKITEKFSQLVKPTKPINSYITNLTGITNDMVAKSPEITDVLQNFMEFLGEDCILGHNVHFDINFIYTNLMRHLKRDLCNNYTDTIKLAKKHCDFKSYSLSNIAKEFGISTEGHHRALQDCFMTFEIYKKIKENSKHENIIYN